MSTWKITYADGRQDRGMAIGTPEQVYAYLADGALGIHRIDVHDADALTWPGADEQPTHE